MIEKISTLFNTVRYMTYRQWKYRIYYTMRDKVGKRKVKRFNKSFNPIRLPLYYSNNVNNINSVEIAERICSGEIPTISDINVNYNSDWDLKNEAYRLVSFKLNSFWWLICLSDAYKITCDKRYIDKGFEYIAEWNEKCGKFISGDKWNAYVIAERIFNWVCFLSEYANDSLIVDYCEMIYSQALALRDSIEFQLGGNHLLSEAKAMMFAGAFVQDKKLYDFGKKVLIDEANEQFYDDGGHYEQSVSYHVEALQQYFETYALMEYNGDIDKKRFISIMRKAYSFLNGMIGVNGKIPLFNDSAYDYPFYDAADFLATAGYIFKEPSPNGCAGIYTKRWEWLGKCTNEIIWDNKSCYKNTGFIHYRFDIKGKKYSFFMDCGNNGPDYNLGHTHADALSVLLYSEDKEILVDSGVFTYKQGAGRNECRSTKAHNTVEIDGKNSSEIWSAFRVAKRGYSKIIKYAEKNGLEVIASHDGYARCLKMQIFHIRRVCIKDNEIIICDRIKGKGRHKAISRFHISSKCNILQTDAKTCIIDNIIIKSNQCIKVSDCYVAGMFGKLEKTKCIEIGFDKNLKTKFIITEKEI